MVTNIMEYPCPHPGCRKVFKRKGDLTRHRLLHSGVRPHVCRSCKKSFAQASALKTHLNVHTGAKPYECLVEGCFARFGDPSSRTRHTKETHEAQTRFRCPMAKCSAAIKRGSSFRTHLRKVHGVDADRVHLESCLEPLSVGYGSSYTSYHGSRKEPEYLSRLPRTPQPNSRVSTPGTPGLDDSPASIVPPTLLPINFDLNFQYPIPSDNYLKVDAGRLSPASPCSPYVQGPMSLASTSPASSMSPLSLSPCPTPPTSTQYDSWPHPGYYQHPMSPLSQGDMEYVGEKLPLVAPFSSYPFPLDEGLQVYDQCQSGYPYVWTDSDAVNDHMSVY